MIVRLGRALLPGEFHIKLSLLRINEVEVSCKTHSGEGALLWRGHTLHSGEGAHTTLWGGGTLGERAHTTLWGGGCNSGEGVVIYVLLLPVLQVRDGFYSFQVHDVQYET